MPVHAYKFFAPTDAARMSKLQLTARQFVEGGITGRHKSQHRGFSVEFAEHRDYVPGDELRHLDWRAYARSDRYYIKLFAQETNLRATLVLDNSNSMTFAGKMEYARHVTACLAFLLASQQDLAGLAAVDDSVKIELPPGSAPSHLDRLFRELESLQPGKTTDLSKHLHGLAERLARRSLVIIVSDLWLTDTTEFSRALQHLRYRRHQAIVLHLLDKSEIELPYENYVTLQDLETGERVQIDPRELRDSYRQQVEQYLSEVRRACSNCEVEYTAMFVNEPYDKALTKWINRRK
jgi:uncharacterized protein (DUF58 family)